MNPTPFDDFSGAYDEARVQRQAVYDSIVKYEDLALRERGDTDLHKFSLAKLEKMRAEFTLYSDFIQRDVSDQCAASEVKTSSDPPRGDLPSSDSDPRKASSSLMSLSSSSSLSASSEKSSLRHVEGRGSSFARQNSGRKNLSLSSEREKPPRVVANDSDQTSPKNPNVKIGNGHLSPSAVATDSVPGSAKAAVEMASSASFRRNHISPRVPAYSDSTSTPRSLASSDLTSTSSSSSMTSRRSRKSSRSSRDGSHPPRSKFAYKRKVPSPGRGRLHASDTSVAVDSEDEREPPGFPPPSGGFPPPAGVYPPPEDPPPPYSAFAESMSERPSPPEAVQAHSPPAERAGNGASVASSEALALAPSEKRAQKESSHEKPKHGDINRDSDKDFRVLVTGTEDAEARSPVASPPKTPPGMPSSPPRDESVTPASAPSLSSLRASRSPDSSPLAYSYTDHTGEVYFHYEPRFVERKESHPQPQPQAGHVSPSSLGSSFRSSYYKQFASASTHAPPENSRSPPPQQPSITPRDSPFVAQSHNSGEATRSKMPQYLPSIVEDAVAFMKDANAPVAREDFATLFARHCGYEIDFALLGGVQTIDEILAASADVRWSEERQAYAVAESAPKIPPETRDEIYQLFGHEDVGHLYRFSRSEIFDAYESVHKKPLDPEACGYQDVYDMLLSLPGISCGEQKDNESGPTKHFNCFEMEPPSEQLGGLSSFNRNRLISWFTDLKNRTPGRLTHAFVDSVSPLFKAGGWLGVCTNLHELLHLFPDISYEETSDGSSGGGVYVFHPDAETVKIEHDLRAQVTAFLHRVPRVSELLLDHVYRVCHNGLGLSRQVLAKLGYFTTFDFVGSIAGASFATRNGVRVILFGEGVKLIPKLGARTEPAVRRVIEEEQSRPSAPLESGVIIHQFPPSRGVTADNICRLFVRHNQHDLVPSQIGFVSLRELLLSIPGVSVSKDGEYFSYDAHTRAECEKIQRSRWMRKFSELKGTIPKGDAPLPTAWRRYRSDAEVKQQIPERARPPRPPRDALRRYIPRPRSNHAPKPCFDYTMSRQCACGQSCDGVRARRTNFRVQQCDLEVQGSCRHGSSCHFLHTRTSYL